MERQIEEDQAQIAEDSGGMTSEEPLQGGMQVVAQDSHTHHAQRTALWVVAKTAYQIWLGCSQPETKRKRGYFDKNGSLERKIHAKKLNF